MSRAPVQLSRSRHSASKIPDAPRSVAWLRSLARAGVSPPALAGWLVAVTLLAAGPLQGFDEELDRPWSHFVLPAFRPFFQHVLDNIAEPRVAMSVVSVVSLVVAWRAHSVRPLIVTAIAVSSETSLVVALKIITARPRPLSGDPSFFQAGQYAIIYPSGHAANAILIYGICAYLLCCYTAAGLWLARLCWAGVGVISVVATVTSLYLGWHWATDLIGGLLVGALVLRTSMTLDRRCPAGVWIVPPHLRSLLWRLEFFWRLVDPYLPGPQTRGHHDAHNSRAPSLTNMQAQTLRARAANRESKAALAAEFGISRETVYTYLDQTGGSPSYGECAQDPAVRRVSLTSHHGGGRSRHQDSRRSR